jgi:hypothetical protein
MSLKEIYPMESYSDLKKNKIVSLSGNLMKLESIMLSKINQAQEDNYHTLSLIFGVWIFKGMKVERRLFGKRKGTSRGQEWVMGGGEYDKVHYLHVS